MPKIRLSIETVDKPVVDGQPFSGKYLFKLGDAAAIADGVPTADFDLPSDGTYACTCQSLDTSGAPISDGVSMSITLVGGQLAPAGGGAPSPSPAPAPQTYPAPASLSAAILAD